MADKAFFQTLLKNFLRIIAEVRWNVFKITSSNAGVDEPEIRLHQIAF
jgi:hypothetical protein